MKINVDLVQTYRENQRIRFQNEWLEWLRIPSISTDPAYAKSTRQAADWLYKKLSNIGLHTELIETCGQPLVYAESGKVEGAPTVLIYGHYDVQPPDPLDKWVTPPFEPDVRDGNVYARGATDDKGQFLTHVFAVESWLQASGNLPLQVKFLVEGEEESGGAGLNAFLKGEYDQNISVAEKLASDVAVISDCSQFGPGQPAITYGLRGGIYGQLNLTGPNRDLHSGRFGGAIANPANVLTQVLDSVLNEHGQIQVPGFYDAVTDISQQEQDSLDSLDFSDQHFRRDLGLNELHGEAGYGTLARRWCRPTFDVHGLWSGYQGAGAKTVLPSTAGAKFSFRLVPDQEPAIIRTAVKAWFRQQCPAGITMELNISGGSPGFVLPLDSPFVKAASRAIERGFETRPVFIRSGGSIPIVNRLRTVPGIDTLLLGWGQDDDNLHSPNEKLSLSDFHHGIRTSCFLMQELANLPVT